MAGFRKVFRSGAQVKAALQRDRLLRSQGAPYHLKLTMLAGGAGRFGWSLRYNKQAVRSTPQLKGIGARRSLKTMPGEHQLGRP